MTNVHLKIVIDFNNYLTPTINTIFFTVLLRYSWVPVLVYNSMIHQPPDFSDIYCTSVGSNHVAVIPFVDRGLSQNSHTALVRYQDTDGGSREVVRHVDTYPRMSVITAAHIQQRTGQYRALPSVKNNVAKREREEFVQSLPTRVQVKLDQKFGKDNIVQCFKAKACLRHVLIPLYKSGLLSREYDWENFRSAFNMVDIFLTLWDEHQHVNFDNIQGYQKDWDDATVIDSSRVRMSTAALLHFDGDIADTVRWIGGPHVGEHRDTSATLAYLKGKVDEATYTILATSWYNGVPQVCNAAADEENFRAYLNYGNHDTVNKRPDIAYKTLLKDCKRGYCLVFDPRMVFFALNVHVTPIGLVGLDQKYKKPRPIFDSSFRPKPRFSGINDWTTKETEPPLHFAESFMKYLGWIYNLRITYPKKEIYLGDDDVSGAFRHMKYNPNLVGMHSCVLTGHLACSTGMTFGDNTSPSNFEPIADARRQLAKYLWKQPDTIAQTTKFLDAIQLAELPSVDVVRSFVRADADSIHKGVLDSKGNRLPPQFDHHVDDNIYADVGEHMYKTVCSSVLALWQILGFPSDDTPDPLSRDKFCGKYSHARKSIGHHIDSREMTVSLTEEKRDILIEVLTEWISVKKDFNLREISSVHGSLESATRFTAWARPLFFHSQNVISTTLKQRYHILQRNYKQRGREIKLTKELTPQLMNRLKNLIACEKAKFLWNTNANVPVTKAMRESFAVIRAVLQDESKRWVQPIGYIIERDPHVITLGDASGHGGGAYCESLSFWFDIVWSKKVTENFNRRPATNSTVHINSLEFIVVILQYVATAVRITTLPTKILDKVFPRGIPAQPVLLCRTDNTAAEAWANKVTSQSPQGQRLIGVMAELLRTNNLGLNARHIAGVKNVLADFISRPTHFDLSFSERAEQIFQKHELARTWDFFQPSPELLQSLSSLLFSERMEGLPSLPKNLGHFVRAGSTILCSPEI